MEKINGLAVYEDGPKNGLPLVLIHGFPFTHRMWEPQIPALLFPNQYRVISYDVRGHGASETGDGQFTLEFFAEDLIGILNHLKIHKAVVCGLSMGGYIALRAAERNPERFKALILCDTKSEPDSNEAKIKRSQAVHSLKNEGVSAFAQNFLKAVLSEKSFRSRKDLQEFLLELIQENKALGLSGALIALAARTDTTPALEKMDFPVMLLAGDEDRLTPPEHLQGIKKKFPQADFFMIPDAGHISNVENPGAFNEALLGFLKKIK